MLNKIRKIFSYGYNLVLQEKLVSLINIVVTMVVVFFIWSAFLTFYFLNQMVSYLQERLDFSIYFKQNVEQENILKLQKILQNFPGVNKVEFVPREIALEKFKKEIQNNPIIVKAIQEIQSNPLVDYLIVKADTTEVYPKIADYLEKSPYRVYVDYVTYFENVRVIQRIINISSQVKFLISLLAIIVLVIATLILFNSVLISIHSQREEIEVLRIIGASNWFIRGPFFVYIFITSLISYILTLSFIIIILMKTENFWPTLIYNFQPTIFVAEKFFVLNAICFGIILIINFLSVFIATQKYLKQ